MSNEQHGDGEAEHGVDPIAASLPFTGVPVYVVRSMCRQVLVQEKTHRKSRINKKWRKRYGMRWVRCDAADTVLHTNLGCREAIYACPHAVERLRRHIRTANGCDFMGDPRFGVGPAGDAAGDLTPRATGG